MLSTQWGRAGNNIIGGRNVTMTCSIKRESYHGKTVTPAVTQIDQASHIPLPSPSTFYCLPNLPRWLNLPLLIPRTHQCHLCSHWCDHIVSGTYDCATRAVLSHIGWLAESCRYFQSVIILCYDVPSRTAFSNLNWPVTQNRTPTLFWNPSPNHTRITLFSQKCPPISVSHPINMEQMTNYNH